MFSLFNWFKKPTPTRIGRLIQSIDELDLTLLHQRIYAPDTRLFQMKTRYQSYDKLINTINGVIPLINKRSLRGYMSINTEHIELRYISDYFSDTIVIPLDDLVIGTRVIREYLTSIYEIETTDSLETQKILAYNERLLGDIELLLEILTKLTTI